ncbi:MAG: hypothetical protein QXF45_04905 [Candidatus Caldarchaeum sp.]
MPPLRSFRNKSRRLSLRLAAEMYEWLVAEAVRAGLPLSMFVRHLIRETMRRR